MNKIKQVWDKAHSINDKWMLTNSSALEMCKLHNITIPHLKLVMEIGIGFGNFIKECNERENATIAIDISQIALDRVKFFSDTYLTKNMISISNNIVDLAVCHLVFQHCKEEIVEFIISNTIRILKPNGIFSFQFATIEVKDYKFPKDIKYYKEIQYCIKNDVLHFISLDKIKEIVNKYGKIISVSKPMKLHQDSEILWYFVKCSK